MILVHFAGYNSRVIFPLIHRLVPETFVYVGGMHLVDKPALSLGNDLAAFVDGAEHGVVLFSFGIQFDYKILPPSVLAAILSALGRLRQRVVARLPLAELGLESEVSANMFCMDYLPQAELMAHTKERLHGSLLRVQRWVQKCLIGCVNPVY